MVSIFYNIPLGIFQALLILAEKLFEIKPKNANLD